jgi:hypothetical protein
MERLLKALALDFKGEDLLRHQLKNKTPFSGTTTTEPTPS